MAAELGAYSCVLKIGEVLDTPGDTWLDLMIESYPAVSDFVLNRAQIRAWVDEYAVLQRAFRELPAGYRELDVVFEYVIPQNRPLGEAPDPASWIRPDAASITGNDPEISISIGSGGVVRSVSLSKSSGNAVFDQSVLSAARAVRKFEGLSEEFIRAKPTFTVEFNLRKAD